MKTLGVVSILMCLIAPSLPACSVCMGAANSLTASAANGAIFLMLGFIGAILLSIVSFAIYLARRSAAQPSSTASIHIHGERKHA